MTPSQITTFTVFLISVSACGLKSAPQEAVAPAASMKIFMIAPDDAGRSGPRVGCGDSVVGVERQVASAATTADRLKGALSDLLSLHDPHYGQSGLSNALAQSRLEVSAVTVTNGKAEIRLSGTLTLAGACDAPRVESQIRQTALQFPDITSASILIDGTAIEQALSGRGQ